MTPRPAPSPKFTKNCMCDKYTNCTDCQQHDIAIHNATLDAIIEFTKGNSETIEADDGTLEDAVFLGELLAKIESLRTKEHP